MKAAPASLGAVGAGSFTIAPWAPPAGSTGGAGSPRCCSVGPAAAYLVGRIGWPPFFVVTFLCGLPGLVLLWMMRERVAALDVER